MSEIIIPHNHLLGADANTNSQIGKDTDYIGFIFNNKHSSDFGIVRISEGGRFNENLLPVISDKTVQASGSDGAYFFGSSYDYQIFEVPFAFDNLTEEKFQGLKKWLGDKKIHDLIFDEAPYKIYRAKITGSATIKHIPFSEGETNRIYKGEGSIQFTAYDPFARSAFKFLSELENSFIEVEVNETDYKSGTYYFINSKNEYEKETDDSTFENGKTYYKINPKVIEWMDASGMLINQGSFDKLGADNKIPLYNPGVKEADFILGIKFDSDDKKIPFGSIKIDGADSILKLNFREITKQKEEDVEIRFNSKLNLVEGYNSAGIKTGSIYNRFIESGDFFKIPLSTSVDLPIEMILENVSSELFSSIDYNYYYF